MIIIAIALWILAVLNINKSIRLTKVAHEKKSMIDHVSDSKFADYSLPGCIIGFILAFTYGAILDSSPWWLAKGIFFLLGSMQIWLGVLAWQKGIHCLC